MRGLAVQYDNRDSFFSPTSGYHYALEYLTHGENIGGDYDYDSLVFNAVNYWLVHERVTVGLRLHADAIYTDQRIRAPYIYPFIDMRGVPRARYQGSRVASAEIQGI